MNASRRVRLCLEEKNLSYESHVVDMARMEHHSPEYLRINSNGVVPALIHVRYVDEINAGKHPRVTDWWTKIQARSAFTRARIGPFLDS